MVDTKSTKVQKYKKLEKYYKKAYEKAQKFKRLSERKSFNLPGTIENTNVVKQ